VGCVIVPTTGAVGESCEFMVTFADDGEVQPDELVTVKVYVPGPRAERVMLVPVPGVVILPGFIVMVHEPVPGNPFKMRLPVASEHVGWVIVPTTGAVGITG